MMVGCTGSDSCRLGIALHNTTMADRTTQRRAAAKARAKFDKLQALFDAGASPKERRAMSDSWQKRASNNTGDLQRKQRRNPRDAGVSAGVSVPKGTGQFKKG